MAKSEAKEKIEKLVEKYTSLFGSKAIYRQRSL